MSLEIRFLGAADTVTGSRHLVTLGGRRILLDCGLFQGFKTLRERNWGPLGVPAREIDAVVLSHAHLDHSGWLPALVRSGYSGPIHASPATCDLAAVLLQDSAHLQEEDARRANRQGFSRHEKALPLYTRRDAQRAIAQLRPLQPGRTLALGEVALQLSPVGHLLGACAVTLRHRSGSLGFSGDVGRDDDLLMPPPQALPEVDTLLLESTYGDRCHVEEDAQARLGRIVRETVARGGRVLLPSFAVGRAQALLLLLQRLRRSGQLPHGLPIYLDSPMAIEATALYRQHRRLLRLPAGEVATLADGVQMVAAPAQSQKLAASRHPAVVISASGMATGGRVLSHLAALLPDPRHHVVLAGFQVGGSRGARLLAGEREIRMHGQWVPVAAQVSALQGLSGHADAPGLLRWLQRMPAAPRQTFIVHGEPAAADALRTRIGRELGWSVRVPQHGESVTV